MYIWRAYVLTPTAAPMKPNWILCGTFIFLRLFQIHQRKRDYGRDRTSQKKKEKEKKNTDRQERQIAFETCNSTVCRLLHVCNVYDRKSEEASDN